MPATLQRRYESHLSEEDRTLEEGRNWRDMISHALLPEGVSVKYEKQDNLLLTFHYSISEDAGDTTSYPGIDGRLTTGKYTGKVLSIRLHAPRQGTLEKRLLRIAEKIADHRPSSIESTKRNKQLSSTVLKKIAARIESDTDWNDSEGRPSTE